MIIQRGLLALIATYFLYFGQLGVLVPYLGIFLDGRGLDSQQIGELLAIITLARIVGPSLWASVADKTGRSLGILQLGSFLAAASFSVILLTDSVWGIAITLTLMMMFWTAVLPQLEVITLTNVAQMGTSYGKVRLWGSIGFIVLTVLVGYLLDIFGSETPVYAGLAILTLLFISTLFINVKRTPVNATKSESSWSLALSKPFIIFILSAALLQVSFGAYYGFFALYMRDIGYTGQQTGLLIALGVLAEIFIFLAANKLVRRFNVYLLLTVCMLATAFRWLVLALLAEFSVVVVISQLIHALSFGLAHVASMQFISQYFPVSFHSRGQALYISLAFGIGGAIGGYVAGAMWQQGANATATFLFSAIASLVGGLLFILLRKKEPAT